MDEPIKTKNKINSLLILRGMKQEDLAAELGCTREHLCQALNGGYFSKEMCRKLAEWAGLEAEEVRGMRKNAD